MSKKVLVLEGSPRVGGNTDVLADAFVQGAADAGFEAEKVFLAHKNIHPCLGCGHCRSSGENACVFKEKDDFEEIIQKVLAADVLVLSSPVYFYSFTAQMKTALDRFYAREAEVKNKVFYLITAGGAPTPEYMDTMVAGFRGFLSCFENAQEGGILKACGLNTKGEAAESPYRQQAYGMGKGLWMLEFTGEDAR